MESHTPTPWHVRRAAYSHYRRFEQLVEMHRLTETWVRELQVTRPAHALGRGLGYDLAGNLWMLENPSERGLEALLDDTSPDDVLTRLERTIWAVQAYTLRELLNRTGSPERTVLDSVLEQISWRLGREYAERRWAGLSLVHRESVRRLLLAFADTPFGAARQGHSFLIHRATDEEAEIELHHCPHQSPYNEVSAVADELCAIHSHWTRGFGYGLHHRLLIRPELIVSPRQDSDSGPSPNATGGAPPRSQRRCRQLWYFTHVR